jgi:hypothetical protein
MTQGRLVPNGDAGVIALLQASVLAGMARAVALTIAAAWGHSRIRAVLARRPAGRPVSLAARRGGTMLLVAAVVHLGLGLTASRPAGWLWLIVPGVTLASAAILIVASRWPSSPTR